MKKVIILLIVLLIFIPSSLALASGERPIRVFIDREEIIFNTPPMYYEGRLIVPMRPFFRALGAEIEWDGENGIVTAQKGDRTVILRVNEPYALVNSVVEKLDTPVTIIQGSTMVPLRFLSEFLGLEVRWSEEEQRVDLESSTFVPFERFLTKDGEEYPWVEEWVQSRWDQLGIEARLVQGKLYILTTFGLKPYGGYDVEIKRIERSDGALKVVVQFTEPSREQYTIPVFNRPYDLVYVNLSEQELLSYLICFARGLNEGELPVRLDLNP